MLGDDDWITQYVFYDSPPRNTPRPCDQDGLSALSGRLSVHDAAKYVRFQVHTPYDGDGVRHASVNNLRAAGFVVTLTPSRRISIHVSVSYEAEWNDEVATAFDTCWTEVDRWYEGR